MLARSRVCRRNLICLIDISAHNSHAFDGNNPGTRNFDFAATHYRRCINHGGITLDTRLSQINVVTSADGQDFSAAEIFTRETALKSAQNRDLVKVGISGASSAPLADLFAPGSYLSGK